MVAAAAVAVASTGSASKAKKTKAPASHPPFAKMIVEAIAALKEKGGSSRQAILKYIKSHYKVDEKVAEVNVRRVLVSATASGKLVRVKGTGASGSFKLSSKAENTETPEKPKRAAAVKHDKPAKKPAASKPPKTAAKPKKVAGAAKPKKSHAKKVTKKTTVKTSKMVKSKRPATKKAPKKTAPKK
ncbi:hypothetical protein Aperf_G00000041657 [Anoplocephala perfoliata]